MKAWRDNPARPRTDLEQPARAYFEVGLPELTVAACEEALQRSPSDRHALANLARLADAAGLAETAAAYRRRLASSGLAADMSDRAMALPVWPFALAAARLAGVETPPLSVAPEAAALSVRAS